MANKGKRTKAGKQDPPKKLESKAQDKTSAHRWTFLSNYTHVLLCIRRKADVRVRDIAREVGITERAVQRIISELSEAGAIQKERVGRRNHYSVNGDVHLRHPLEEECTIGELLEVLGTTLQR